MADEFTDADMPGDTPDKSATERATETIKSASHRGSDALEAGREPGMPLDSLARLAREAPLPSLAVAFLLGVVVARRR